MKRDQGKPGRSGAQPGGNWREDVLFELQQAVDSYHFAHRQMLECDRKIRPKPPRYSPKPVSGR
jgi:hypothetical protein